MVMNSRYPYVSTANPVMKPCPDCKAPEFRRHLPSFFGLCRQWRDRVRQRRALAALDNRTLSDIGLDRQQVLAEIEKPFWQA